MPNDNNNEQQVIIEKPTTLIAVAWISCVCLFIPVLNMFAVIFTPITSLILIFSKNKTVKLNGTICFIIWSIVLAVILLIGKWWVGRETGSY